LRGVRVKQNFCWHLFSPENSIGPFAEILLTSLALAFILVEQYYCIAIPSTLSNYERA